MSRNADRSTETVYGYAPFKLPRTEVPDAVSVFEALVTGTTETGDVPEPARWVKVADKVMPLETVAAPAAIARIALPPPRAPRAPTSEDPIEIVRSRGWMIGGVIAMVLAAVAIAYLLWPEPDAAPAVVAKPAPPPAPPSAPIVAPIKSAPPPAATVAPIKPVAVSAPPPAPKPPITHDDTPKLVAHGSCTIHIDADALGSVVIVDGRVVGDAPVDVDGIYCGRRTQVTVANPRFAPWERSIVPEEGKPSRVHARLARLTTAIAVTSTPSAATVRVNGKPVAVTPAAISVIADASTTIEVELLGYRSVTKQLVPRAGATSTIDAALEPVTLH